MNSCHYPGSAGEFKIEFKTRDRREKSTTDSWSSIIFNDKQMQSTLFTGTYLEGDGIFITRRARFQSALRAKNVVMRRYVRITHMWFPPSPLRLSMRFIPTFLFPFVNILELGGWNLRENPCWYARIQLCQRRVALWMTIVLARVEVIVGRDKTRRRLFWNESFEGENPSWNCLEIYKAEIVSRS